MQDVEIRLPGAEGNPADIIVGGERVRGVSGFTFSKPTMKDFPRLTLEMPVHPVEFHGKADVWVSDRVRETLIRFGWTPPPADMVKESGQ